MLNQCVMIGRLTRDVESRETQSGKAVANFTLAVDRPFTNQQGEREADFIQIVTWGKQAENCTKYIGKGSLVAVAGRLQIRSYDGDNGKKWVSEIVADVVKFLDNKKKQDSGTVDDMLDSATEIDPGDVPF